MSAIGQSRKSTKIDFQNTSNYSDLADNTIYSLNRTELTELLSKSDKKYTLLISYGFWCKPCQEHLLQIIKFSESNNKDLDLFILSLEPDDSKRLFVHQEFLKNKFGFTKPNFMISEDYGQKKWKKYDAFLLDLIGEEKFNKIYTGMSQCILYQNGKIVYLSNYNLTNEEILSDLKEYLQ